MSEKKKGQRRVVVGAIEVPGPMGLTYWQPVYRDDKAQKEVAIKPKIKTGFCD